MSNLRCLRNVTLAGLLAIAGCSSSSQTPQDLVGQTTLGVASYVDAPADVAAVRTFYVVPNTQPAMSGSYTEGASLQQVFAGRIASRLTDRGLTQAPPDSADARAVFVVQNPTPAPAVAGSSAGLGYADQLLTEAKSLQTSDNFLKNDHMNMRIHIIRSATNQTIWHGTIAGVAAPGEDNRGRLLDMLAAVDKMLSTYPQQK